MSVEDNKEIVRRFFTGPGEKFIREALKKENPMAILMERTRKDFEALMTPDFFAHGMGGQANLENYIQINAMMCMGMPDVNFPVKHIVAEGDYVAVFCNTCGTHEGPMPTPNGILQGTGEKVKFDSVYFFRCDKGKIAEIWGCHDTLTWMQQLGAIPK
jgi:predicted ester cyclase